MTDSTSVLRPVFTPNHTAGSKNNSALEFLTLKQLTKYVFTESPMLNYTSTTIHTATGVILMKASI